MDDIVYAIDGLGQTASRNSWQDSATTLAEICNTRRGRQAFRYAVFWLLRHSILFDVKYSTTCIQSLASVDSYAQFIRLFARHFCKLRVRSLVYVHCSETGI